MGGKRYFAPSIITSSETTRGTSPLKGFKMVSNSNKKQLGKSSRFEDKNKQQNQEIEDMIVKHS
uniref:Uncharacterized protein n=1 Tax=Onchocerca volvulus TaxID=6282 RepID=A0A8R1TTI2_ONCVO